MLGGVVLVSFSLLALEISLTRLLSVVLSYHYVFAVVSLASLGLGIGGFFIHHFSRPFENCPGNRAGRLALFAALVSLSIATSVLFVLQVARAEGVPGLTLLYPLVLVLPFAFGGALMAEVFRFYPALSATVYAADMTGAALGSVGVVFALEALGAVGAALLAAVSASAAATLFAARMAPRSIPNTILSVASATVAILLTAGNVAGYLPEIPIGNNPEKEIHDALHGPQRGTVVATRWSSFGRTDLVRFAQSPDYMDIYLDGTAGTPMYAFTGDVQSPGSAVAALKTDFPGYFPLLFLEDNARNHALIIGPGGGRDILLAKMSGFQHITAVEVNRDLVQLVRDYSWYNGGIYTHLEGVDIVVEEGRHFLKRQTQKYDLIMLTLPVTNTSRSREGYTLTENFLLTTQSITDYLNALTDQGQLVVVTHDEVEVLRVLALALAALRERGLGTVEAMKRLYILGSFPFPVFVLKNSPFQSATAALMYQAMRRFGYSPRSSYFPHIERSLELNQMLLGLASGQLDFSDVEKMVAKRGYDVRPVTDDSPFFYKLEAGLPRPVVNVFMLSVILLLIVATLPPLLEKRVYRSSPVQSGTAVQVGVGRAVLLFALLGVGFMLVEIALTQKLMLFLGRPVLAVASLLFSLLLGAGAGSLWSGRVVPHRIARGIAIAAAMAAVTVLLYTLALPTLLDLFFGNGLLVRLLVVMTLVVPLGFIMGFPFPLGIRWLKETGTEHRIAWMWAVNGVSSVVGSASAVMVAIAAGFTDVLLLSVGCYLSVALSFASLVATRTVPAWAEASGTRSDLYCTAKRH